MTKVKLSPEIVSLIHHVELNESGWWKKAIGQVVKGVLWKIETPQTLAELRVALSHEVGVSLMDDVLVKQLDILMSQGAVTKLPNQSYKLTEQTRNDLNTTHEIVAREQEDCRNAFLASCQEYSPDLDASKVWERFQIELIKTIRITGANLYHLLEDGKLEREVDWLSGFLNKFEATKHDGLRRVLTTFFASTNHACRRQVLRLMTAHFFAEASQLRPETIAAIEQKRKQRTIKVVLDTNLIFSILELHDNPANDAALSLADIALHSGGALKVKLYVLPGTIEEAKRTLTYQAGLVDRIRTTTAISRAALTQPLPSIAKKFFESASNCSGLSAQSFFQPYINDLRIILQQKGIAVLDANPSVYNQRPDVIDDINDELSRENDEIPNGKRKTYETHLHDIVLWHAINDRRSVNADSPFEIEYWVASIDWRLINFDRRKRRSNVHSQPIVLHPSNLMQLIQFWVPRTQELEDIMVDSLRLPLFFESFDPEDEKATIKVLEAISRFENIGDLKEETISSVLASSALREKLRDFDASNDAVFELIRDELLAEHNRALQIINQTQLSLTDTTASLEEELKAKEVAEQKAIEIEMALKENVRTLTMHEQRATIAETTLARLRYIILFVAFPIVMGSGLGIAVWYSSKIFSFITDDAKWFIVGASSIFPLVIACILSPYYTSKHTLIQNWWLSNFINHIGKKGIIPFGLLVFEAVIQGGVWDWFKALTGWQP